MKSPHNVFFVCALIACATAHVSAAETFQSSWQGTRVWVGPEYWANPLQDWRIEEGELIGKAAPNRDVHLLTHQIADEAGDFTMEVTLHPEGAISPKIAAGIKVGIRGPLVDYRHALVHANQSLQAGVLGDGRLFINDSLSDERISLSGPVHLQLRVAAAAENSQAELVASDADGAIVRVTLQAAGSRASD